MPTIIDETSCEFTLRDVTGKLEPIDRKLSLWSNRIYKGWMIQPDSAQWLSSVEN